MLLVSNNLMVPLIKGASFSDFVFSLLKQEACIFFSFPILTRWTEREINGEGELEGWDGDNKGVRTVKKRNIFRKIRS